MAGSCCGLPNKMDVFDNSLVRLYTRKFHPSLKKFHLIPDGSITRETTEEPTQRHVPNVLGRKTLADVLRSKDHCDETVNDECSMLMVSETTSFTSEVSELNIKHVPISFGTCESRQQLASSSGAEIDSCKNRSYDYSRSNKPVDVQSDSDQSEESEHEMQGSIILSSFTFAERTPTSAVWDNNRLDLSNDNKKHTRSVSGDSCMSVDYNDNVASRSTRDETESNKHGSCRGTQQCCYADRMMSLNYNDNAAFGSTRDETESNKHGSCLGTQQCSYSDHIDLQSVSFNHRNWTSNENANIDAKLQMDHQQESSLDSSKADDQCSPTKTSKNNQTPYRKRSRCVCRGNRSAKRSSTNVVKHHLPSSFGKRRSLGLESVFNIGLGIGMSFMLIANRKEVDRLNSLLERTESLVREMTEQVSWRYSRAEPVPITKISDIPKTESCHHFSSGEDYECVRSNELDVKPMEELEAALVAELELMEQNLTAESFANYFDEISENSPAEEDCPVMLNEPTDIKNQTIMSDSLAGEVMNFNCAVSPHDLDRRLHEVLEVQQEERIIELEEHIKATEVDLIIKEKELQYWKDIAHQFIALSSSKSVKSSEVNSQHLPQRGPRISDDYTYEILSSKIAEEEGSIYQKGFNHGCLTNNSENGNFVKLKVEIAEYNDLRVHNCDLSASQCSCCEGLTCALGAKCIPQSGIEPGETLLAWKDETALSVSSGEMTTFSSNNSDDIYMRSEAYIGNNRFS